MDKKAKVNASILIIGNEILSGRTQDTNTSTLAIWLNSIGVNVAEVRVIPDVEKIIVDTLNLLRSTYDYVFTTGGIGPTHDDITAQSVSKAFAIKYEVHKEAFKILEKYYQPGEFNEGRQKMAWMPQNAKLILKSSNNCFPKRIIEIFKKNKVYDLIEFYNRADYPSLKEHLKLYKKIDIALDTFPYNGVTTSFEALWCGIPVLTVLGYNFNSRCGSSILKNANLDQLILKNSEEYIKKALELSNNINQLSILRKDIF